MRKAPTAQPGHETIIVQNFVTDNLDDLFCNVFNTTVAAERLRYVRKADWRSNRAFEAAASPEYLRPGDELLLDMRDECDLRLTFRRAGNLVRLFACAKFKAVTAVVAGCAAEAVEACLADHYTLFEEPPEDVKPDQPKAQFAFWYIGEKGPEREQKELGVPTWSEIRENYGAATAAALDGLLSGFKPGAGGRLVLWHGKPGTGKTFAIRALAWEWREWCRFEYVLDPENLFGARADYLARMLIDGREDANGDGTSAPWRMLVLEDTGELLSVDAKERAGQGLSRLLNVVDGLLGQGSRVMLLLTTNEELGALHPAVSRPGRCTSQIEFVPLSPAESKAWLTRHAWRGDGGAPRRPRTLAELYAMLEGRSLREVPALGFRNSLM